MPAGYEYEIDHRVIHGAAWDHVTLDDLEHYLSEAARLPDDLRGAIEYLDLSEVITLQVSTVGALQLAPWYEALFDRGIRGSVIFAPDEEVHEIAETIISTCSMVSGGLPDGYCLTRQPIAPEEALQVLQRKRCVRGERPAQVALAG